MSFFQKFDITLFIFLASVIYLIFARASTASVYLLVITGAILIGKTIIDRTRSYRK